MKKKLLFILSMLMVGTAIHAVPAKRGIWKTFTLKTDRLSRFSFVATSSSTSGRTRMATAILTTHPMG